MAGTPVPASVAPRERVGASLRAPAAPASGSRPVTLALLPPHRHAGHDPGRPAGRPGGRRRPRAGGARAGADPAGHQPLRAVARGPHRRRARRGADRPAGAAVSEAAREVAARRGRSPSSRCCCRCRGCAARASAPPRWPCCWRRGRSCWGRWCRGRRARRARPPGVAPRGAAARPGVIAAVVAARHRRPGRPGAAHGLVRPARDRPADPHPGVLRQPGGQPPRAALRRDPARPRRVRLGTDPGPPRPPAPEGPAALNVPLAALVALFLVSDALERRPRGGRGQGRLLLPALHRALPAGAGLVAARRALAALAVTTIAGG